jgi:hypothetical protein
MGHLFRDQQAVLLHMMTRHSHTAFTLLTVSSLPNSKVHTELFICCQPHCLVCTDSLSILQYLGGYSSVHPIVAEILSEVSHLHKSGRYVMYCWIHGDCGLSGNKPTDVAAKVASVHRMFVIGFSAVMFAPAFIVLFYPYIKTNGVMLRGASSIWCNHLCRSGSPPSESSGKRKSH